MALQGSSAASVLLAPTPTLAFPLPSPPAEEPGGEGEGEGAAGIAAHLQHFKAEPRHLRTQRLRLPDSGLRAGVLEGDRLSRVSRAAVTRPCAGTCPVQTEDGGFTERARGLPRRKTEATAGETTEAVRPADIPATRGQQPPGRFLR